MAHSRVRIDTESIDGVAELLAVLSRKRSRLKSFAFGNTHPAVEEVPFDSVTDPRSVCCGEGLTVNTQDGGAPSRWRQESHEHADRGRFASTIKPQQSSDGPSRNRKRTLPDNRLVAKVTR